MRWVIIALLIPTDYFQQIEYISIPTGVEYKLWWKKVELAKCLDGLTKANRTWQTKSPNLVLDQNWIDFYNCIKWSKKVE